MPALLPPEWSALRTEEGAFPGAIDLGDDVLIADLHGLNRGGRGGPEPFSPRALLVAEIDRKYMGQNLIPALAAAHLASGGHVQYDIKIVNAWSASSQPIYVSGASASTLTRGNAEDSIALDFNWRGPGGPGGPPDSPGPGLRQPPEGHGEGGPREKGPMLHPFFGGPPPGDHGKQWLLLVRHKAGSLEALVEKERRWNLVVAGGMLLLIFATGLTLVRFTRASQRLAELRLNIVAGVSHELRSPLAVIRTAAFNLQREGFSSRPDQVRRYGELIGAESTRLERLVENVLRFAALGRARAAEERESIDVTELLNSEVDFFEDVLAAGNIQVERSLPANLPRFSRIRRPCGTPFATLLKMPLNTAARPDGSASRRPFPEIPSPFASPIAVPGFPSMSAGESSNPSSAAAGLSGIRYRGAGLGLSLAAEIVRAQGGSIEAAPESMAGGGLIIIQLPLTPGGRVAA